VCQAALHALTVSLSVSFNNAYELVFVYRFHSGASLTQRKLKAVGRTEVSLAPESKFEPGFGRLGTELMIYPVIHWRIAIEHEAGY
jgi:hypothetical protein